MVHRCFKHMGHPENVDASRERGVLIDQGSHHVRKVNRVSNVGMPFKNPHHIVKVADIHGNAIQNGALPPGGVSQAGDGFCIRGLIGGKAWNPALQNISSRRIGL